MDFWIVTATAIYDIACIAKGCIDRCIYMKALEDMPVSDIGSDLISRVESSPDQTLPYVVLEGIVSGVNAAVTNSVGTWQVLRMMTANQVAGGGFLWNIFPARIDLDSSTVHIEAKYPDESSSYSYMLTKTPSESSMEFETLKLPEHFLPLGAIGTVVGSLMKDPDTGTFILKGAEVGDFSFYHFLSALSKGDILAELDWEVTMKIVFAGLHIFAGLKKFAGKVFEAWEALTQVEDRSWYREMLAEIQQELAELRLELQELADVPVVIENMENYEPVNLDIDEACSIFKICIVCKAQPREVIILDCGHVCVCVSCVQKVRGKCPVCREIIVSAKLSYILQSLLRSLN